MNILTAAEFIAQGTSAGAIMSIAAHPEQPRATAQALRAVAAEVATITGQTLVIPGAVTEARLDERRRRRTQRVGANDNRHSGAPRNRRAA